ncbi:hypothetical protein GGR53DRAFT_468780 [Hypoxylon sp. FL1150]|nr:hypothetical protein GGR53DRAFT_468780 [Hypoxylon sp. FL1150]
MQLLAILFSLAPAFVASIQAATSDGPNATVISDTCNPPDLSPSGKHFLLWAACKTKDRCYGDDNGNVVARKDGKLSDHCTGCRLGNGNRALGCVCKEKPDKVTWVTLDNIITNEDGFLQCYDDKHRGSETCGQ